MHMQLYSCLTDGPLPARSQDTLGDMTLTLPVVRTPGPKAYLHDIKEANGVHVHAAVQPINRIMTQPSARQLSTSQAIGSQPFAGRGVQVKGAGVRAGEGGSAGGWIQDLVDPEFQQDTAVVLLVLTGQDLMQAQGFTKFGRWGRQVKLGSR